MPHDLLGVGADTCGFALAALCALVGQLFNSSQQSHKPGRGNGGATRGIGLDGGVDGDGGHLIPILVH